MAIDLQIATAVPEAGPWLPANITVWKVLDRLGAKYTSYWAYGGWRVDYTPGTVIRHPNMFVFRTLSAAQDFQSGLDTPIFECRTTATFDPPKYILNTNFDTLAGPYWARMGTPKQWNSPEFWFTNPLWDFPERTLTFPPDETVLVNDLYMLREVHTQLD